MDWQSLKNADIRKFIQAHEHDDVAALALGKLPDSNWNAPLVLGQIKARQKARSKMPHWADNADVIFPPPALVEQASSAACAAYKSGLVQGQSFVDLTAGMGADTLAFAGYFANAKAVDLNQTTTEILQHTFQALGQPNIQVTCASAEDFAAKMEPVDLVYLDPQRRDETRKGKFILEQTSPDILKLLPLLQTKAKTVMLKTSPMLDISQACAALGGVREVHIVEWRGECKEVLYILDFKSRAAEDICMIAVSLDDEGRAVNSLSFTPAEEKTAPCEFSMPLAYLYEPSPALLKAGGFKTVGARYGLKKLHPHTHLYTTEALCVDFPGRTFKICGVYPAQKEKIPLKKANITVRNFPASAESLHKKLKIAVGGPETLLACLLMDNSKTLIHGQKI